MDAIPKRAYSSPFSMDDEAIGQLPGTDGLNVAQGD
jgi:hypothetical protein